MLDKIEDALEVEGIHYERLDGTMKREERNRALDALKNDPRCEVLLGMSLFYDFYWTRPIDNALQ